MHSIGPQEALLMQLDQEQESALTVDTSQSMWDYRNKNTYNGIPVEQTAQDLKVNNAQQLQRALQLKQGVVVWTGYLSPQYDDKKSVQQYRDIRQKQAQGLIRVYSQDRQFCPQINKFLVLVTYASLSYQLNPRLEYLKQEQNNE